MMHTSMCLFHLLTNKAHGSTPAATAKQHDHQRKYTLDTVILHSYDKISLLYKVHLQEHSRQLKFGKYRGLFDKVLLKKSCNTFVNDQIEEN